MDPQRENLRRLIEEQIPFLQKVAVRVEEIGANHVRLRLPHDPTNDNYVGTTHAAAIFSFGETCAGLAAGAVFDLTRLRMLARRAEIEYRKPVTGDLVSAVEIAPETVASVEQKVERQGKAALPIKVTMKNAAQETVAEMTVEYHFRRIA